jgi:hypothetical protein
MVVSSEEKDAQISILAIETVLSSGFLRLDRSSVLHLYD